MHVNALPQIISPISEKPEQDSFVYACSVSDRVTKIYWECDERCLESYAGLQNELAEHSLLEELSGEYFYKGKVFSSLKIDILKLPTESYSASFIGKGVERGTPVMLTRPKHIKGENLNDLYRREDDSELKFETLKMIGGIMREFVSLVSEKRMIECAEAILENAIVCGVVDGVLHIILTDITGNIPRFVRLNDPYGLS